jgi:hypothetical protein
MALTWLGEAPVTSISAPEADDLDRAHIMLINYAPARDATLEAHDWSFAMMRFIPPLNLIPPVYGAGNAFDVPTDILRIISVDNPETDNLDLLNSPIGSLEQIDWVFENRQVICNEDVIYCRGIRRIEQEGFFSPLFVHAFAAKLAFLTAMNLTSSAAIQANMLEMYNQFIMEAKTRDGLQGRTKRLRNRSLLKSR